MAKNEQAPPLDVCYRVVDGGLNLARSIPVDKPLGIKVQSAIDYTQHLEYWGKHRGFFQKGLYEKYSTACRELLAIIKKRSDKVRYPPRGGGTPTNGQEVVTESEKKLDPLRATIKEKIEALGGSSIYYAAYIQDSGLNYQDFNNLGDLESYAKERGIDGTGQTFILRRGMGGKYSYVTLDQVLAKPVKPIVRESTPAK